MTKERKTKRKEVVPVESLSHVQLFAIPWMVARQAPWSMGFPRQEYWSGLSFPSPEDLPDPGTEPRSPALAGRFFTTEPPGKTQRKKSGTHLLYSALIIETGYCTAAALGL